MSVLLFFDPYKVTIQNASNPSLEIDTTSLETRTEQQAWLYFQNGTREPKAIGLDQTHDADTITGR